jgi:HlyD family secretion protein
MAFSGCARTPEEMEIRKSKDSVEIIMEGVIKPSQEANLTSPFSGRIKRVFAKKGKKVSRSESIVEFDQQEAKFAYRDALLRYEKAVVTSRTYSPSRAENSVLIHNAKSRLLKTYELYKAGSASIAELKDAEGNYMNTLDAATREQQTHEKEQFAAQKSREETRKDLQRARLDVEQARYPLNRAIVRSPIDGYLVELKQTEGQTVSEGEIIGRVIDLDRVVLRGEFSPGIYKFLSVNRQAGISCVTTPPFRTSGVISEISPVTDPDTGRMSLFIPLKNDGYLLQPGVKCLITLVMSRKEAEQLGVDVEEGKAYIKSNIRSPEPK